MISPIKRVAVIGAGTMGSQLAALMAGFGLDCDLLDIVPPGTGNGSRNVLAERALERLKKTTPKPAFTDADYQRIRPGNIEDDLPRLREADWVIEAVVEQLAVKQQLWAQVAPHLGEHTIASTNTSGLPVSKIAAALPEDVRSRFLGTHFFNPPRYLRLLELIPLETTDPEVIQRMQQFLRDELGKGVVIARDTPNFIGNRIGVYGLMITLAAMKQFNLSPDQVDIITGPPMGRPRSATFRTLDLVGLDVFASVVRNMQAASNDEAERQALELPDFVEEMLERGWLGEKTGQGFFKRERRDGERVILALDPETMEYRPRQRLASPVLEAVRNVPDPAERIRQLVTGDDVASQFAWTITSRVLAYTANKAAEISDDLVSIDRAMRWGFGWELGPFEIWDAIGTKYVVERMQKDGLELPQWVLDIASHDQKFYDTSDDQVWQVTVHGDRQLVATDPKDITRDILRKNKVIRQNAGATLLDIGDGVAFLNFHSQNQAIGPDFIQMLNIAADEVERGYDGLVLSSTAAANFCVGANLFLVLMAAQEEEWDELDLMVKGLQQALMRLKYLSRPVVVAAFGQTLGGGLEIAFAADKVVASVETYAGLVEMGAGVIPAGGGCKEMLLRNVAGQKDMHPALAEVFETIGTAKVATSAFEARQFGFFRLGDRIVANPDQLLYWAKQQVLALNAAGYRPPEQTRITVAGREGRAVLELGAHQLRWAGFATDHDLFIARKLAYVLTGGDLPAGTEVTEDYILDLERSAFLSLVGEPKTQQRMQHLLKTGRPLRN